VSPPQGPQNATPAVDVNRMRSNLALEDQLLLEACRVEISPQGAQRVAELIRRRPDWQYLLEASIRHAVAPLLKHGLDRMSELEDIGRGVPSHVLRDLHEIYVGSRRRNVRLFDALKEVVATMRAAGAEPVGLKDVQLAVATYPDVALRPMGDIDLLVRRSDWDAAASALASLGFLPKPSADVPFTRKYAVGQHFRRAADDIWIDLQWNVMQREWDLYGEGSFTWDAEAMWTSASQIEGLGFELRAPTREDMLFHLCLHLEGHRYCELILFCDIAEFLRREGGMVDWQALLELGQEYGANSSLYYVLLFAARLLDAPVPLEVLQALAPRFFDGDLHAPLFGNLTPLHLDLDELRLAADPPEPVLEECERVVRRQTVRAMRLNAELTGLVSTFAERGGTVAVAQGQTPARVFPDSALPPFEPIRILVLERESRLLEETFAENGFTRDRPRAGQMEKTLHVSTMDPALMGSRPSVTLEVESSSDVAALFPTERISQTNARAAVQSLRARFAAAQGHDEARVRVVVHSLEPEALAAVLAASVGLAREDRLFRTCSLIELLRRLPESPASADVAGVGAEHGVEHEVMEGLAVAGAILDFPRPADTAAAPRVLQWARYGPESVIRYPWLRAAYYFALSLLATADWRARAAYLARALLGGGRRPAVLPAIALAGAKGAARMLVRPRPSVREFAYWLEPATLARLSPNQTEPSRSPSGDAA
jgi:Uncharacterised nucleotidyltransferase